MGDLIDFKTYQERTSREATGLAREHLWFNALSLGGEAGEAQEKVKKFYRDDNGVMTPERREGIKRELGDVLWCLSQCATTAGIDLNEVALENLAKVAARKHAECIHGDGDNRELERPDYSERDIEPMDPEDRT